MSEDKNLEIEFEEALDELEEIVDNLEDGNLSLDESLSRFSRGVKLINFCRKELNSAEKKVEKVLKDSEGEFREEIPFDEEENGIE